MKGFAYFIAAILLTLCAAWPSSCGAEERDARMLADSGHLELDSCILDLGCIPPDTVSVGVAKFRNTGSAPLQVISVFSDCGCTSTSYPTDAVGPGEEGMIRVSFNAKGRRPGPFRRVLRIRSDGDNPRVTLSVKGIVTDGVPANDDTN